MIAKLSITVVDMGFIGNYIGSIITDKVEFERFRHSVIDTDTEGFADTSSSVVHMKLMVFGKVGYFVTYAWEFLHRFDCSFDHIVMHS